MSSYSIQFGWWSLGSLSIPFNHSFGFVNNTKQVLSYFDTRLKTPFPWSHIDGWWNVLWATQWWGYPLVMSGFDSGWSEIQTNQKGPNLGTQQRRRRIPLMMVTVSVDWCLCHPLVYLHGHVSLVLLCCVVGGGVERKEKRKTISWVDEYNWDHVYWDRISVWSLHDNNHVSCVLPYLLFGWMIVSLFPSLSLSTTTMFEESGEDREGRWVLMRVERLRLRLRNVTAKEL